MVTPNCVDDLIDDILGNHWSRHNFYLFALRAGRGGPGGWSHGMTWSPDTLSSDGEPGEVTRNGQVLGHVSEPRDLVLLDADSEFGRRRRVLACDHNDPVFLLIPPRISSLILFNIPA